MVAFILIIGEIFCFGAFNLTNGRNHPELEWKEIESEHLRIVYSTALKEIAMESIVIGEASYESLSKSYRVKPDKKFNIYISDQDKIANGASVFDHYIFVYVNQNDFMRFFSGNDNFLRKVISHEMSHHFLFYATSDWLTKYLPLVTAGKYPRDLNEGFAQFYSGEPWGINRGDKYLRNAVYSNDLGYESGKVGSSGLVYGKGFSMVRYLFTFYGEEKIAEWFSYRDKKTKLFEFKKGFKKVFEKDFSEFEEEWRRYIYTYYYGKAYQLKQDNGDNFQNTLNDFSKFKTDFYSFSNLKFQPNNQVLFTGKKDKNQQYFDFMIGEINPDSLLKKRIHFKSLKTIIHRKISIYSMDRKSENVVYACFSRQKYSSLIPTIFKYNIASEKTKEVTTGNFPQIMDNGSIIFQIIDLAGNYLREIDKNGNIQTLISYPKNNYIANISLNLHQNKLAVSLFNEHNKFITKIYDLSSMSEIYSNETEFCITEFFWEKDDTVFLFSESKNQDPILVKLDLKDDSLIEYQSPLFGFYPAKISLQNDSLKVQVLAEMNRKKLLIGEISLSEKKTKLSKIDAPNFYSKWINAKYSHPINYKNKKVEMSEPIKYNSLMNTKFRMLLLLPLPESLLGSTIFSEALGKHFVVASVNIPYKSNKHLMYNISYINKCFTPTITLSNSQYEIYSGIYDHKLYYHKVREISSIMTFPNLINKTFWSFIYGIESNYCDYKIDDQEYKYFENNYELTASAFSRLSYNLPYLNSKIHPIRNLSFGTKITKSLDFLSNDMNFEKMNIETDLSFAPFYSFSTNSFLKTINFRNIAYYEKIFGNYSIQTSPGIGNEAVLNFNGIGFSGRHFLRGYEKSEYENLNTILGDEIILIQNEVWLKLSDNLNFKINWQSPLIAVKYLGVGFWIDYTKINQKNISSEINTYGGETKTNIEIFGVSTIHKMGTAYNFDHKKIGFYYNVSIPIDLNI